LIAQESGEDKEIARAMSDLVNSCTFGKIDGKTAALFDVEYIFLQIRGKSVGETVELNVLCPDDGETSVSVKLAIDDINITMLENHTNEIMIQDDVKIVFRYPILSDMEGMLSSKSNVETVYQLINRCIQSIHYGDDVYNKVDITEKDVDEFVDQLTGDQFELLVDFFDTMPKLRHVIKVTNPKTKKKNEVVLEGLQSFLG
jgi:hypothetical protein